MRRKVAFLLAICMLLVTAFTGCGKDTSTQVALFDGDDANFIIVRPADADLEVISIASDFRQNIIKALDISVPYKPDTIEHQEGQIEINVGLTNRELSKTLYDEVVEANKNHGMDWMIHMDGDFIYIVGATNEALRVAVETFYANFCRDTKMTIKSDYKYLYHYEGGENKFEFCGTKDMSEYCVVTPKYNMPYLIGREVSELQASILAATGSNIPEKMDSEKESEYEIVIGGSERSGIPECSSEDEYRITMKDKKLYICGGSDEATAIAVKEVATMVKNGKSIDKKTDIKGSYAETLKKHEDYYSLKFADNFDALDTSIWDIQTGNFNHQGETDKQRYFTDSAEALYTEDGNLVMKSGEDSKGYWSTEIRTAQSLWYKYGLVEISAKFDVTKGVCPAFWVLGLGAAKYHGEYDVFEAFGKDTIRATPLSHPDGTSEETTDVYYCGTVKAPYDEAFFTLPEGETFADEYHTFGLEWDETSVRWTYDGRVFLEINTTFDDRSQQSFNSAMQLLLTIYSGVDINGMIGMPDETTDWSQSWMKVDYLRLYQTPGQELLDMREQK